MSTSQQRIENTDSNQHVHRLLTLNYNINKKISLSSRKREKRLHMIVSTLSDWNICFSSPSLTTSFSEQHCLRRRVLNLIISHMSEMGTPLIKVNEGMTFWTDEPSQNLMGGEYFHFKKGLRNRRVYICIQMVARCCSLELQIFSISYL